MRETVLSIFVLSCVIACSDGSPSASDVDGSSGAGGEGPAGSGGATDTGSGGQAPAGSGGSSSEEGSCEEGCVLTLAADCDQGPDTLDECVSDCEALLEGECGTEYRAFQACSEGESIACSEAGIPVVPSCSEEQEGFVGCLNGP